MNEQQFMQELADNLWQYFLPKLNNLLNKSVTFFRAKIVARATGGFITVQRPTDDNTMKLPYVTSMANAAVGSQVTVMVFGSLSNSIIIGDGTLSNL